MKSIYYLPKDTSANTEYRQIRSEDHDWLITYLFKTLVAMALTSNTANEDHKIMRDQWWRRRRSSLPRGKTGQNTPESMIAGILHNMLYAQEAQRDFTQKQCDAIEDISKWMSAMDEQQFEQVQFAIKIV